MFKITKMRGRLFYTIIMILVLAITMVGIVSYIYGYSEKESVEKLHLEAVKFKNNINIQMNSDMETLRAMAELVSEGFNDEDSYEQVCKNFEAFGFCENIGILVPDNRLITKFGTVDVSDNISFAEEAVKGEYISNKVKDATNAEREIMRCAVPIKSPDGTVAAVMYGTIDIARFSERYRELAEGIGAYLCILDGKTGDFIIDTKNTSVINITRLAAVPFEGEYSYDKLASDLHEGKSGYTSFLGYQLDENIHVYYDTINVENWRLMLAQPRSVVFAGTMSTIKFLVFTSCLILLIMLIYMLMMLMSIRKMIKINACAADIRKSLLEITQRRESLRDALKYLCKFANSRSAFITDSYEEEQHYIQPSKINDKLMPDEITYFNRKLILYASRHRGDHGAVVHISSIKCDDILKNEMRELYDFMLLHKINDVIYAVVINNNSNIYALGVLNTKNEEVKDLLKKVAVCFSMSVYNNKYLRRTERMALTDSLTGLKNRMAFTQYIKENSFLDKEVACIYVDVNELHFYNNKYGHAAGDQMLKFIADSLKKAFDSSNIYRMGGDEFLILSDELTQSEIHNRIGIVVSEAEEMKYHIAVGVKYGKVKNSIEEIVNEAEKIMYDAKSRYYQDKELTKVKGLSGNNIVMFETGVKEIDACMSVMTLRYLAVYCVSLEKDACVRVLAPAYFKNLSEEGSLFSSTIKRYVYEFVKPEYHRALMSFLDYEVLKKQLLLGNIPSVKYERIDGEKVVLKIYPLDKKDDNMDSVWVFEKQE